MKKHRSTTTQKPKRSARPKEPAYLSYFFGASYKELWGTIRESWVKNGKKIASSAIDLIRVWHLYGFYKALCLFIFRLGILISVAIFGTLFTLIFSALHIVIIFVLMILVYIGFIVLKFIDAIFCLFKGISTNCYNPNCERKFRLPIYRCPKCGRLHYHLVPSKYGILKRKCLCGTKLPTTFINGRQKLDALCPYCNADAIKGVHRSYLIPVIGGPSSGKTCFVNMGIKALQDSSSNYGLEFVYQNVPGDEYQSNIQYLDNGNLPMKTNDLRFKYYNFYLTKANSKIKNLVSICDIAGEVFTDRQLASEQEGYRFADGLVVIVDPLSITDYAKEVSSKASVTAYRGSAQSMNDVASCIVNTLEGLLHRNSKQSLGMYVAIVFTKLDIPGLDEEIGDVAINQYIVAHPNTSVLDANNAVCEDFLRRYNETSFLNIIKTRFKEVQFFSTTALGHNPSGQKFTPKNVAEPLLWVIDKASPAINLNAIWKR